MVRVAAVLEDGRPFTFGPMNRWYADWWLANLVAVGYVVDGARVVRATIVPLVN